MRRPSCFLLEARTEVLQDESDVNVDESFYEREWDEKCSGSPVRCAQGCRKGQCARRRDKDEFKQTKKAPPWVGPMYEAHRSWQLPGQCSADIIM